MSVRLRAFILAVFFSSLASASVLKLGYINFEAAFAKEQEAQKHIKDLEAKENAILEGEQKARVDIESKMNEFRKSMAKLSEKARSEKENALSSEISSLQQQFNQKRQDLLQERQQILVDLESKNRLILDSLAKEEKFDVVFSSSALVYVSPEIKKNDLSEKVVDRYNKAYPVKAEAKKPAKDSKKRKAEGDEAKEDKKPKVESEKAPKEEKKSKK